jgi:hypothetical protein
MNKKTKKTLLSLILGLMLISLALFFKIKKTQAQIGMRPFGGNITHVDYCCNGLVLTVTAPDEFAEYGGSFFIDWASVAIPTVNYANYMIFVGDGQPTIGEATGVGTCVKVSSECESSDPVYGGKIIKIGTGLAG